MSHVGERWKKTKRVDTIHYSVQGEIEIRRQIPDRPRFAGGSEVVGIKRESYSFSSG